MALQMCGCIAAARAEHLRPRRRGAAEWGGMVTEAQKRGVGVGVLHSRPSSRRPPRFSCAYVHVRAIRDARVSDAQRPGGGGTGWATNLQRDSASRRAVSGLGAHSVAAASAPLEARGSAHSQKTISSSVSRRPSACAARQQQYQRRPGSGGQSRPHPARLIARCCALTRRRTH